MRPRAEKMGDLYAADVLGARAAGVHPVLLDPFDDWEGVDCLTLPDIASLGEHVLGSQHEERKR